MIGLIGSIMGDAFGVVALGMIVGAAFLMKDSVHALRLRRRQQRERERARREFWGYE